MLRLRAWKKHRLRVCAADGSTLLLSSQTNALSATRYAKLPFNPVGDFAAVSVLGREPGVLMVNPAFPARSVAELIAYPRQNPGRVDDASSGNGSGRPLFPALFNSMAGMRMNHAPYRGSAQATTDLVAGVAGYSAYVWMGLMAPRNTPPAVIASLNRESVAAPAAPNVRGYFDNAAIEPVGSTAAQFGSFFREEKDRRAVIVRETGARTD